MKKIIRQKCFFNKLKIYYTKIKFHKINKEVQDLKTKDKK